ncbi:MAG: type II secretion system protein [Sedimentisphaerales bacterium]|nr:type II secretion system protein [Sedimentisphaerales bacterium]
MRSRAFTLIELLLVVTIFAMAAVLTGLAIYHRTDHTALASSSRRLLNAVRYARLSAAEHHRSCQLHIDIADGRYWLTAQQSGIPVTQLDASDAADQAIVTEEFANPSQLPTKVRFAVVRVAGDSDTRQNEICITFHEDGTADAALIQLATEDEVVTLLIYPWTGRAELRTAAIDVLPSQTADLPTQ